MRRAVAMGMLVLALASCAARRVRHLPPTALLRATMATGVGGPEQDFAPLDAGSTFSAEQPELVAWIRLEHLSQVHSLRWLWYAPDGTLYYDSGEHFIQPTGTYHSHVTAWHRLPVAGQQAAVLTGDWRVIVEMDQSELATLRFRLEPGAEQRVGGTGL